MEWKEKYQRFFVARKFRINMYIYERYFSPAKALDQTRNAFEIF